MRSKILGLLFLILLIPAICFAEKVYTTPVYDAEKDVVTFEGVTYPGPSKKMGTGRLTGKTFHVSDYKYIRMIMFDGKTLTWVIMDNFQTQESNKNYVLLDKDCDGDFETKLFLKDKPKFVYPDCYKK